MLAFERTVQKRILKPWTTDLTLNPLLFGPYFFQQRKAPLGSKVGNAVSFFPSTCSLSTLRVEVRAQTEMIPGRSTPEENVGYV